MGETDQLKVPDYQVLRKLISSDEWDQAKSYLNAFHGQNFGMLSMLTDWCVKLANLYAEKSGAEAEVKLRSKALSDYHQLLDKMAGSYSLAEDKKHIEYLKNYFNKDNLLTQTNTEILAILDSEVKKTLASFESKNKEESLKHITAYHHRALLSHDAMITFIYSYPTTIMGVEGEVVAIDISNGAILQNPIWNGLWELTKILEPIDLAAFLAEHLRFHFSGKTREGSTQVIEDDKKIRLIFDPCGSGGALRQRLGSDIKNFKDQHNLAWNKCNEVNLYCSHCALNEQKSIDLFGYPKLVVEFDADPAKPCGWTMYKNKEDIPAAVYERLGLKK